MLNVVIRTFGLILAINFVHVSGELFTLQNAREFYGGGNSYFGNRNKQFNSANLQTIENGFGSRSTLIVVVRADVNIWLNSGENSTNTIIIHEMDTECMAKHAKNSKISVQCKDKVYTKGTIYMNTTTTDEVGCNCDQNNGTSPRPGPEPKYTPTAPPKSKTPPTQEPKPKYTATTTPKSRTPLTAEPEPKYTTTAAPKSKTPTTSRTKSTLKPTKTPNPEPPVQIPDEKYVYIILIIYKLLKPFINNYLVVLYNWLMVFKIYIPFPYLLYRPYLILQIMIYYFWRFVPQNWAIFNPLLPEVFYIPLNILFIFYRVVNPQIAYYMKLIWIKLHSLQPIGICYNPLSLYQMWLLYVMNYINRPRCAILNPLQPVGLITWLRQDPNYYPLFAKLIQNTYNLYNIYSRMLSYCLFGNFMPMKWNVVDSFKPGFTNIYKMYKLWQIYNFHYVQGVYHHPIGRIPRFHWSDIRYPANYTTDWISRYPD